MTRKCLQVTLILLSMLTSQAMAQAQTLIVNPDLKVNELSRSSLRAMFAMRVPQWPDGSPVQVFVLEDDNPLHVSFCKTVLGMFPYQLRRIWDRQVFSGTGVEPIIVSSEEEMLARVAQTKGAIGYIEKPANDGSVKILRSSL